MTARVAVLISGRGSNLQALIDATRSAEYPARIVRLLSNVPGAPGIHRAEAAGIPTSVIDHRDFADRDRFDSAMNDLLSADSVDLICLAGFMRLLTPGFVEKWRDRLINIHPSLLPAFKGLHVHERVIDSGARFSGCTVHFVRPDVDTGPIIVQAVVPVAPDDTPERLAARVLEMEHTCYPLAVRLIAEKRVRIDGERVIVDGGTVPMAGIVNPSAC
jgi:phosphoribosylglycinamide formyltransferase-1